MPPDNGHRTEGNESRGAGAARALCGHCNRTILRPSDPDFMVGKHEMFYLGWFWTQTFGLLGSRTPPPFLRRTPPPSPRTPLPPSLTTMLRVGKNGFYGTTRSVQKIKSGHGEHSTPPPPATPPSSAPHEVLFPQLLGPGNLVVFWLRTHRALCPRSAKSRLLSTPGSHESQGPVFCTPDAVWNGSCIHL